MPEPVTVGLAVFGACTLKDAYTGLKEWLAKHLSKAKDEQTELEKREQLGAYLQSYGWELRQSPYIKFMSIMPLHSRTLQVLLKDPRFEGCKGLQEWVHHKVQNILQMSHEPGVPMTDTCSFYKPSEDQTRIESTYGLFWAKVLPGQDAVKSSFFESDTAEEVRDGLLKKLGDKYKDVADEVYNLGIDGVFLAEEDSWLEELDIFGRLPKLQQTVLRNHFARYKPVVTEKVPSIALCVVATTVVLEFNDILEYNLKNRVAGRVSQEKIMTYLKMRMAAEKPHELLDLPAGNRNDTSFSHVASEALAEAPSMSAITAQ